MREKDEKKVDIIYKASLRLIRKNGLVGITMAKIAHESGLATGTIYIYFKNKEDLINSLYNSLRTKSLDRFLSDYDPTKSFEICLKKIWTNYLKHRIEHHEVSVFLVQYYHSPYITKEQKRAAQEMKNPVLELIQRGKNEQFIRDDTDNELLFTAMIGFIRELADEHVDGNYALDAEKIEKAFQLSWDMVKA